MSIQGEREMVELTVCDLDQPAVVEKNGVLQDVVGIWGPDLDESMIPENCPRLNSYDAAKKLGCIGCGEKKIVIEEIKV